MHPLEGLAGQARWAARNLAHNLDFVPEEKWNWKPTPTSKSAQEILNEVVVVLTGMKPVLTGGQWTTPSAPIVTDRTQAKQQVIDAANAFADALRSVNPADLGRQVELPFATLPLERCAGIPIVELIHHHGQIAYLQTMWGDTQSHFFEMGS
jgi:hypothetical protein